MVAPANPAKRSSTRTWRWRWRRPRTSRRYASRSPAASESRGPRHALLALALALAQGLDVDAAERVAHSVKVSGVVASACPPRVECTMQWTAPLADPGMVETKRCMNAVQRKIVTIVQAGDGTATTQMNELRILMARQMAIYKGVIVDAEANAAPTCGRLVKLVRDLNPKYAQVYDATGKLARSRRYQRNPVLIRYCSLTFRICFSARSASLFNAASCM